MKNWRFNGLLQASGWLSDIYVCCNDHGKIISISQSPPEGPVSDVSGFAVPGFQNAHSHVFQYAMSGLAENLRNPSDDFWSWREVMYELALTMTPESMEAVATWAYAEMARHGYTAVTEFHYLHHNQSGDPFENPAEMGLRLMSAARKAGIHLTLIPIFYHTGDFGKPASPHQRRFINSTDTYQRLQEAARAGASQFERVSVGWGIHSLRAATPEDVTQIFAALPEQSPLHIHIAEQMREVNSCLETYGKRPVAWLLDNAPVDERCFLVHATHVDESELAGIQRAGAGVVICPSTEGNLGDGFFPIKDYNQLNGSWSIGTDSHIGLSPMEELRWLDYGQRLSLQQRNTLCQNEGEDSGRILYHDSLIGGRAAMGLPDESYFRVGGYLDAVILDAGHPLLATAAPNRRLSTLIYGADAAMIAGVISGGDWIVQAGRHVNRDSAAADFIAATAAIRGR